MSSQTATRPAHSHRPVRPPRSPWIGVGLGAAIVAALFLVDRFLPSLYQAALPSRAQDGLTLAMSVLIEALPFVILGVLGVLAPTPGRTLLSQICTALYFAYFILMPFYTRMEKTKPVPERVTG